MTQIDSDDDGTKDNADGDIGGVAFNKPPSFTSTPPSQAFENTEYSYFVTAHDAEGDSFTLEVVQPSGATMVGASNNSGIFVWTPLERMMLVIMTSSSMQ